MPSKKTAEPMAIKTANAALNHRIEVAFSIYQSARRGLSVAREAGDAQKARVCEAMMAEEAERLRLYAEEAKTQMA